MSKSWIDYLHLTQPATGRFLAEDGERINAAEFMRRQPISIWRGEYPGAQAFSSHGELTTSGASVNQPVWPGGSTLPSPPTFGVQMSVVSTSAQDAPGGSGIAAILVEYLDCDKVAHTEVVTLNGTTPVLTECTRIHWVQNMFAVAGANSGAVGAITATNAGTVYSRIPPTYLDASSSFRMVPAGHTGYVTNVLLSSVSLNADAYSVIRTVVAVNGLLLPRNAQGVQNGSWSIQVPIGNQLPEGALLGLTVTANKAVTATAAFIGWIQPNE